MSVLSMSGFACSSEGVASLGVASATLACLAALGGLRRSTMIVTGHVMMLSSSGLVEGTVLALVRENQRAVAQCLLVVLLNDSKSTLPARTLLGVNSLSEVYVSCIILDEYDRQMSSPLPRVPSGVARQLPANFQTG